MNHCLPYFRQQLIFHLLSAIYYCRFCLLKVHVESSSLLRLSSLVEGHACQLLLHALFTTSSHEEQLIAPSPFLGGDVCLPATITGFV
jgi:hypothetical protein